VAKKEKARTACGRQAVSPACLRVPSSIYAVCFVRSRRGEIEGLIFDVANALRLALDLLMLVMAVGVNGHIKICTKERRVPGRRAVRCTVIRDTAAPGRRNSSPPPPPLSEVPRGRPVRRRRWPEPAPGPLFESTFVPSPVECPVPPARPADKVRGAACPESEVPCEVDHE
jgi:hypothetical protein